VAREHDLGSPTRPQQFRRHSSSGIRSGEQVARRAVENIFLGSELALVEGPHLYKIDGWYYLFTAEGGTFATHAETVARSKNITGPYEIMPGNPLITSARNPELRLQSAGHGSLVQHRDGTWSLAHLCRRPLPNGRSILGRETALQNIIWKDGWPRLASGGQVPLDTFDAPELPLHLWPQPPARDDFDSEALSLEWQAPRVAIDDQTASLTARKGHLRLYGRESIVSLFEQSLVARRQTSFHVEASTCIEFEPETFQQMAGLVAFYSTESFYYLFLTRAPHSKKCLGLMRCERGNISYPVEKEYPLDAHTKVFLKVVIEYDRARFSYSIDGERWTAVAWEQDASILADEHAVPCAFTGNFVGMACQDLTGRRRHADFDWFEYRELRE
jgi:xylan 1,4-beta-xylosidase